MCNLVILEGDVRDEQSPAALACEEAGMSGAEVLVFSSGKFQSWGHHHFYTLPLVGDLLVLPSREGPCQFRVTRIQHWPSQKLMDIPKTRILAVSEGAVLAES